MKLFWKICQKLRRDCSTNDVFPNMPLRLAGIHEIGDIRIASFT